MREFNLIASRIRLLFLVVLLVVFLVVFLLSDANVNINIYNDLKEPITRHYTAISRAGGYIYFK